MNVHISKRRSPLCPFSFSKTKPLKTKQPKPRHYTLGSFRPQTHTKTYEIDPSYFSDEHILQVSFLTESIQGSTFVYNAVAKRNILQAEESFWQGLKNLPILNLGSIPLETIEGPLTYLTLDITWENIEADAPDFNLTPHYTVPLESLTTERENDYDAPDNREPQSAPQKDTQNDTQEITEKENLFATDNVSREDILDLSRTF